MEKRWSEGWNPNEPIENFFDRLEDCYVQSITQPPAYTSEQMVDKALTAIQTTSLFPTAFLEWNCFMDAHQTWLELKSHFQEAYELQLQSGGFNENNLPKLWTHDATRKIDNGKTLVGRMESKRSN